VIGAASERGEYGHAVDTELIKGVGECLGPDRGGGS
jgi:hypothetical protein